MNIRTIIEKIRFINENIRRVESFRPKRPFLFCSVIFYRLFRKCDIPDYFAFQLYDKSFRAKNTYLTHGQAKKLEKTLNNPQNDLLVDKVKFNKAFHSYICRDWLDFRHCSFEEFQAFTTKHPIFIKKNNWLCQGDSVRKVQATAENTRDLYQEFCNTDSLAEELIIQHPRLAALNPSSVNTVRISTLKHKGTVHVLAASLRVGRSGKCVDNLHGGGVCCSIDLSSGIVVSPGLNGIGEVFLKHPDTNAVLLGTEIPHWSEAIQTVISAAEMLDDINWVGWDVAITENGIQIVEGNTDQGIDVLQIGSGGLRPKIKKILAQ